MSEDRVQRKDLWARLGNIKRKEQWFKVAEELGFEVTQKSGGSSHYPIRIPGTAVTDVSGVVVTVYEHGELRKDVNQKIFKAFLRVNVLEDDIWKALGMLK